MSSFFVVRRQYRGTPHCGGSVRDGHPILIPLLRFHQLPGLSPWMVIPFFVSSSVWQLGNVFILRGEGLRRGYSRGRRMRVCPNPWSCTVVLGDRRRQNTHTHEDQYMYIVEGELTFEIGGEDGLPRRETTC